jgi:hypothetical protein
MHASGGSDESLCRCARGSMCTYVYYCALSVSTFSSSPPSSLSRLPVFVSTFLLCLVAGTRGARSCTRHRHVNVHCAGMTLVFLRLSLRFKWSDFSRTGSPKGGGNSGSAFFLRKKMLVQLQRRPRSVEPTRLWRQSGTPAATHRRCGAGRWCANVSHLLHMQLGLIPVRLHSSEWRNPCRERLAPLRIAARLRHLDPGHGTDPDVVFNSHVWHSAGLNHLAERLTLASLWGRGRQDGCPSSLRIVVAAAHNTRSHEILHRRQVSQVSAHVLDHTCDHQVRRLNTLMPWAFNTDLEFIDLEIGIRKCAQRVGI